MRPKLLFLLGFAVLMVAAYWLFRRDFDADLFFDGFRNVRPGWLAASIAGTFLTYLVRAVRWQVLLHSLKRVRLGGLVSATLLGFSAIYALGRAGEVIRPLWIARRESIPMTGSFAAIVLERVFDLIFIVFLFALSLALVELPIGAEGSVSLLSSAAWLLFLGAAAALGSSMLFEKYILVLARRLREGKLRIFLETFRAGLAATSDFRHLGFVAGYSLILWLVVALQFWLMLRGLNLSLGVAASTLVLVGSALGSIAQIPGIGGGFQAAFVFCLTKFFLVPVETAVAASLVAWIATYAPTLLVAALYMIWKGISTEELIAREPVEETL